MNHILALRWLVAAIMSRVDVGTAPSGPNALFDFHKTFRVQVAECRRESHARHWEVAGSGSILGLRARASSLHCGTFSRIFRQLRDSEKGKT